MKLQCLVNLLGEFRLLRYYVAKVCTFTFRGAPGAALGREVLITDHLPVAGRNAFTDDTEFWPVRLSL